MKRYEYIENKNPRQLLPYQRLLLFDGIFKFFQGSIPSTCLLTVYEKDGLVLAIAHEAEEKPRRTIGELAHTLWRTASSHFPSDKYIFVQGWNGVYEYVKFSYPETPPLSFGEGGFPMGRIIEIKGRGLADPSWHPAGTLEEVLNRHLA